MEFKDFSLHINQTKVGRFAQELASGRIMATRCKTCTNKYYPPRADCARCCGSEMDWVPLEGHGRLATFTMIYVPPDHFTSKPLMPFSSISFQPCPIGLLEVEEGIRILGWIPHVEPRDLRVGMPLQATPCTLPDGQVTIILKPTEPVSESGSTPP